MDEPKKLQRENATMAEQVSALKAFCDTLTKTNESLVQNAKELVAANEDLQQDKAGLQSELKKSRAELEALIRRLFGRTSERFEDPDQLKFEFANQAQVDDALDGIKQAVEENNEKKKPPKRRKQKERFPEGLERKEVVIDLSDEEKEGLVRMGEDVVESAHYTRAKVFIIRKIYPKYVRPGQSQSGVFQVKRPETLLAGDRYDISFAAAVISNRLSYHLPIFRQEDMFAECGLYLSRSTLLNIQEAAERVLRPFAQWLADLVRTDRVIGSDDTSIRLLLPKEPPDLDEDDPKSGRVREVLAAAIANNRKSILAKMWAYRGVSIPINVFDFTVSRHRDGPDLFLVGKEYEGTLLGDCYGANTGIYIRSDGKINHAACAAHARRKVEAALDNHPEHATYLLRLFREIYDVEDEARGKSSSDRLELRQLKSVPLWKTLRGYLDTQMSDILKDDKITEARSYILNQWDHLTEHLGDGEIPIDNNQCEQLMKQVALGRKNWLFVGSIGSGYRTATLMTIVSSAIRNDLDVAAYLEDMLGQLLSGSKDYESLRPDVWAKSHPDSIRAHRQKEREANNTRRDRERLRRRIARTET